MNKEDEIERQIQYEQALEEANLEDGPDAGETLNMLHGLGKYAKKQGGNNGKNKDN